MNRKGSRVRWYGALGLLPALFGCEGDDISVGTESRAINSSLCYGSSTDCSSTPASVSVQSPELATCPEAPVGEFALGFHRSYLVTSPTLPLGSLRGLEVARDGSVWVLGDTPVSDYSSLYWLEHRAADGSLLARNEEVARSGARVSIEAQLALNASENPVVIVFSQTIDKDDKDAFTDRLALTEYSLSAEPIGDATLVAGVADSLVRPGPSGSLIIAGNGSYNARRGAIVRLDPTGEPEFVQSNVPTVGRGIGHGISGLVVGDGGETAVVAEQGRNYDLDESRFAIVRFDEHGNALTNWLLDPTPGGESLRLASGQDGGFFVSGARQEGSFVSGFLASYASDGTPRFGYQLHGSSDVLEYSRELDRVFVSASVPGEDGSAKTAAMIISGNGERCEVYSFEGDAGNDLPRQWSVVGGHLYYFTDFGYGHVELPSEW